MPIDLSTRINAEFRVQRLQVGRKIKIRIHVRSVIFRRRHHVHTPGNAEPSLFPVKRRDAVSALQVHDGHALVRSLRINLGWKMLPAEYCKRSLLHAARDSLERFAAANSSEIFV